MKRIFGALVAVMLCAGCSTSKDEKILNSVYNPDHKNSVGSLVSHLSNDDLSWRTDSVGLEPILDDKVTEMLLERDAVEVNPYLLRVLKEEEKFAIAHVLLTKLNIEGFSLDDKYWNRLRVRPENEEAPYNTAQMSDLIKFWEEVMTAKKEAADDY